MCVRPTYYGTCKDKRLPKKKRREKKESYATPAPAFSRSSCLFVKVLMLLKVRMSLKVL